MIDPVAQAQALDARWRPTRDVEANILVSADLTRLSLLVGIASARAGRQLDYTSENLEPYLDENQWEVTWWRLLNPPGRAA